MAVTALEATVENETASSIAHEGVCGDRGKRNR